MRTPRRGFLHFATALALFGAGCGDGIDTRPDAFSFAARGNLVPGLTVVSEPVTVRGIVGAADISVAGGEYSINGGAFGTAAGTVRQSQQVRVRATAPGTFGASARATLTIGGRSADFVLDTGDPSFTLADVSFRRLHLAWTALDGATEWRLAESNGPGAAFVSLGAVPFHTLGHVHRVATHRFPWRSALFRLEACHAGGCTALPDLVSSTQPMSARAMGYLKPSALVGGGYRFGSAIALDASGTRLVVGAREAANLALPGLDRTGAAYVFERGAGDVWTETALLTASNGEALDSFGGAVALSADGGTLAIGASAEDGAPGLPLDNGVPESGAVYVFTRALDGQWSQQAYLKASNAGASDGFGGALALDATGDVLVIGATGEDSAARGVGGDPTDDTAIQAGAAYVFTRSGGAWSQQSYLKASNTTAGFKSFFGNAVSLSDDGRRLAIGAAGEASAATGIGGDQASTAAPGAGAVYLFERSGAGPWTQTDYLKASNTGTGDGFGTAVELSGDGVALVVGAPGEDSDATGVDGDQANDLALQSGAAYVFERTPSGWTQRAYLKAANARATDRFGERLALNFDGTALAVGVPSAANGALGVDGDPDDATAPIAGTVYGFRRATQWQQVLFLKASNTEALDAFGWSVALDASGEVLAAGALGEDSNATGIGGDQANNGYPEAGAAYLIY